MTPSLGSSLCPGEPYVLNVPTRKSDCCPRNNPLLIRCIGRQLLPKWKGYQLRPEILNVDDRGANTHRLVKVPVSELQQWDREHDEAGRLRRRHGLEEPVMDAGSVEKEQQRTEV